MLVVTRFEMDSFLSMEPYQFSPIGVVRSCFREKFGAPRQALMVKSATAVVKFNPDTRFHAGLQKLERFSHVWIIYVFHKNVEKGWHPTIDTPRVGEESGVGVFASRSPHRPNPIGMSAVKLEGIDYDARGGIEMRVSGVDILHGAPVLDIKPYLPYADSIDGANSGWADAQIRQYPVRFSEESAKFLAAHADSFRLRLLVEQMLEWDPRPTSQRRALPMESADAQGRRFAFRIADIDVHWEPRDAAPYVTRIFPLKPERSDSPTHGK